MKPRLTRHDTEYNTIHQWVLRHYNKQGICSNCEQITKTQWSNISGRYDKNDTLDWQELCPKCHKTYDVKVFGHLYKKRKPSQYTMTNTEFAELEYRMKLWGLKWGDKQALGERLKTYEWYSPAHTPVKQIW